jgi:hypothetical protein
MLLELLLQETTVKTKRQKLAINNVAKYRYKFISKSTNKQGSNAKLAATNASKSSLSKQNGGKKQRYHEVKNQK